MKNGLLVCSGGNFMYHNIGDYIQSLAQEQFFDHIDTYIEREKLKSIVSEEKILLIMNAWFMWDTKQFPPAPCIEPLFISIHITPKIAKEIMTSETVSYLKRHEPIGCRDTDTQKLFDNYGIKNYFSGCLTLTLGMKYKRNEKNDSIYFVDAYYELGSGMNSKWRYLKSAYFVLKNYKKVKILSKNFLCGFITKGLHKKYPKLEILLHAGSFYAAYSKVFDDDILLNAKFIKHSILQGTLKDDNEKLEYARNLMEMYARAKLVVTSRIHCALPCLGVETSTVFINSEGLNSGFVRANGRFGGLIDLLHTGFWKRGQVSLDENCGTQKITINNIPQNSTKYKEYSDNMIRSVYDFLSKVQDDHSY